MSDKGTALIVDDMEEHCLLLSRILSAAGFTPLTATEGAKALEIAERERPLLILLDVSMPEMDGIEVCRVLRRDKRNDNVPVVMLTCKENVSDIVKALEAGADDYLFKSARKEELLNRIEGVLGMAEAGKLPSQNRRQRN
jgi:DNA-binding response OmpR family regulator